MDMMAAVLVARAMKTFGHSPREPAPGDTHLRCRVCSVHFDMTAVSGSQAAAWIHDWLSHHVRCPNELYRPIPGTPWFEYGPAKERR
jgi:hypothetical protein